MGELEIKLPKLGESIVSATVVQWFKKEGEFIKLDEPLLEVSTDKVNSEIPSPIDGILVKIVVNPEEEVDVGATLGVLSTDQGIVTQAFKPEVKQDTPAQGSNQASFFSAALLKKARENDVRFDELDKIPGTGSEGRITKKDLESYITNRSERSILDIQRVKMSGFRKAIADNLVKSFYEAPHATLISEVDVTQVMKYIKQEKVKFLEKRGYKLSITSFITKAIAEAVKEFPFINATLEGDTIILKRFVNLGIAVSVDQGIQVPVIRNCQGLCIAEIAKNVAKLSEKARSGKLELDDVQEGTITMTNFGMAGTLIGIPIIRHLEVAIVGIGSIHKKVVALEDDSIAVRSMMYVSLTFDHRVLDGMYGCGFLGALKKHLENDLSFS